MTAPLKYHLREELRKNLNDVLRERSVYVPSDALLPERAASASPRGREYAEMLRRQIHERDEALRAQYEAEEPSNGLFGNGSSTAANRSRAQLEQRQWLVEQMREVRARREAEERAWLEAEARADLKQLKEQQSLRLASGNGNGNGVAAAAAVEGNSDEAKMQGILEQMQRLTRQLDALQVARSVNTPLSVVDKYFVFGGPAGGAVEPARVPGAASVSDNDDDDESDEDDDAQNAAEAALFALARAASASSGDEWGEPQSRGEQSEDSSPRSRPLHASPAAVKPELNINSFLEGDPSDVLAAITQSSSLAAKAAPLDDNSSSQDGSLVFKRSM